MERETLLLPDYPPQPQFAEGCHHQGLGGDVQGVRGDELQGRVSQIERILQFGQSTGRNSCKLKIRTKLQMRFLNLKIA